MKHRWLGPWRASFDSCTNTARRPHQLLAQTRNVFLLAPDQIVAVLAGPARRLVSHTRFMADSREKYKYETVSLAPLRQRTR